jgi:hypothetical protein
VTSHPFFTYYFLPDKILREGFNYPAGEAEIAVVHYQDLNIRLAERRVGEDMLHSENSKLVGKRWKYSTMYGGKDHRYNGNSEVPIVLYEALEIGGPNWKVRLLCSTYGPLSKLQAALKAMDGGLNSTASSQTAQTTSGAPGPSISDSGNTRHGSSNAGSPRRNPNQENLTPFQSIYWYLVGVGMFLMMAMQFFNPKFKDTYQHEGAWPVAGTITLGIAAYLAIRAVIRFRRVQADARAWTGRPAQDAKRTDEIIP